MNNLLDLSKLDAGRMRIEYAETDLAWLARYVASHFESVASDRQINFTVQTSESLKGQADSEKLQRVLFNLLANAFKFTPGQGAVRFNLRVEQKSAVFVVEDTGPGVPQEMRQAVFERFRQADNSSTRRYGGTGLGLAIVREFVNLHRGSVEVTEAPGGGARFTVTIPLAAPASAEVKAAVAGADEEAARGVVAELRTPSATPTPRRGLTAPGAPLVLVVEDNPEMNEFVSEALGESHRVVTAMDGQDGLEKALSLCPDLIVSDVMMPRMSGEDLVREVRRHSELDDVPILLLTAKADENLRIRLLSSGVQDYLLKPFVTEELVARAASLVARKRKAEATLRQSYALLHAVTEGVNDPIFVKDAQGRYLMSNTAAARRLGKQTPEEVIGKDDATLLGPDAAAAIVDVDRKVIAEGSTLTFEETRASMGSVRTYLTTKGPHRDREDRVIGVLGISRDITERKRAEEDLRRLHAELETRVEQRTAQLATANQELEAFAYTVSHDLRAPLRHVHGFVELLDVHAGPSLDEEGRRYVRNVSVAAERMTRLIDDLLALSRIGRAAMAQSDVNLRQLVDEAIEELAPETAGRAIDWQIGPLPVVHGDRTLLRNVVVNLLSNAVKYTRYKNLARIEIGCQEREGEVGCFVRDNGVGFDMQFVDKLFGVFQRLHAAETFEGIGVGLASVRRIIERHGGRVWAEGEVDQGATFYFALPAGPNYSRRGEVG